MRVLTKLIAVLLLVASIAPAPASALEFGGSLLLDARSFTDDLSFRFINREDVLELKMTHAAADSYQVFANVLFRYFDRGQYTAIDDLAIRDNVQPLDVEIWEAKIDLYSFLFEDLDLTLGKQVLSWGKGDGINPTNYLAPFDLSDPIDFTKRIPVWAVRAKYYLPFWYDAEPTLEFVLLPQMTPMITPPYGAEAFGASLVPSGIKMTLYEPEFNPKNMIIGTKFLASAFGVDFTASYQYAFQMVPTLSGIGLPPGTSVTQLDPAAFAGFTVSDVSLGYPRVHVVGADVATELFGIGMWGEVAVLLPQDPDAPGINWLPIGMLRPFAAMAGGLLPPELLDPKPYVQYIAGIDYTFPINLYTNLQFARGLFFEASPNMSDFLMVNARFFPIREIRLDFNGGISLDNLRTYTKDTVGYMGKLGLMYRGIPSVQMGIEQYMFAGGKDSLFGAFSTFDQLKFWAEVKF